MGSLKRALKANPRPGQRSTALWCQKMCWKRCIPEQRPFPTIFYLLTLGERYRPYVLLGIYQTIYAKRDDGLTRQQSYLDVAKLLVKPRGTSEPRVSSHHQSHQRHTRTPRAFGQAAGHQRAQRHQRAQSQQPPPKAPMDGACFRSNRGAPADTSDTSGRGDPRRPKETQGDPAPPGTSRHQPTPATPADARPPATATSPTTRPINTQNERPTKSHTKPRPPPRPKTLQNSTPPPPRRSMCFLLRSISPALPRCILFVAIDLSCACLMSFLWLWSISPVLL